MEKCSKCQKEIGQYEVFPKVTCVECFSVSFEKEFQSAIKVGGFK